MLTQDLIAPPSPGAPPLWQNADGVLVCRAVRDETHDVKTFVFSAPAPRLFSYKPGQFLTFEFEVGGARINRCYTLASTPTRPDLISITVKRVRGGPVSNWLHDNLKAGMEVKALGPMGEFTCVDNPARKLLFLSAGSGITPLMSMTRAHRDVASDADILFVHSARSPADLIFRDELALMDRENPLFRLVSICEANDPHDPRERWGGYVGRLSPPMLQLIAPDLLEREIYTCGPKPYMAAVRGMLAEVGFDSARYHQESFDFAELTICPSDKPAAANVQPATAETFSVEFTKSRRKVACGANTFVLEAARKAGMRLPSSCTKGLCGTCKSKLLAGTVEMTHAGGIRQREIDAGMILICCSRPTSDLVIER